MMWYDGGSWGWAGWIAMTVGMVAFWGLVITALVLLIRYLASPRGTTANPPPAFTPKGPDDVLAERFARGEIDEDEYRRRLSLLRENR